MLGRNLNLTIMSETKTYVFGNDGAGQCGGGMMSLLAPLLQRNGLDPNLLLAMNKNGNGFGDNLFAILLLFIIMGRQLIWQWFRRRYDAERTGWRCAYD